VEKKRGTGLLVMGQGKEREQAADVRKLRICGEKTLPEGTGIRLGSGDRKPCGGVTEGEEKRT